MLNYLLKATALFVLVEAAMLLVHVNHHSVGREEDLRVRVVGCK